MPEIRSSVRKGAVFTLSCLLFAVFVTAGAQGAFAITLAQAVDLGFETNPEYSGALNTSRAVGQQLEQTRELYLPSLDLEADHGYEMTDSPLISDEELYRRRVSLTLTQLLFNGAKTANEIKRREARAASAELRSLGAAESVALSIVNSYLNVLRYRDLLGVTQKNIETHVSIQEKIEDGAERGRFNLGDVAQIKSRVARARANYESIRQSLSEAEGAYIRAVGRPPEKNMEVPVFNAALIPADLESFIARATAVSPSVAVFDADARAAASGYDVSKATTLPEVSLQLTGSKADNVGGIEGGETSGSALMVMRWNLFRGGADYARTREALFQKAASEDDRHKAARALENEIRDTWAARRSSDGQLAEFRRQIEANAKVVEAYDDQFKLSRRSLLDLLDAQSELFLSKSNKVNAGYSSLFANYRLLALEGSLARTLKTAKPVERPSGEAKRKPRLLGFLGQSPKRVSLLPETAGHILSLPSKKETPVVVEPEAGAEVQPAPKSAPPAALAEKDAPITDTKNATTVSLKKARYAQLGSYRKTSEAEERWKEALSLHADLLSGLEKSVVPVDLGEKGVYYRLQVGPLTRQGAQDLCEKVNERQSGGCVVVKR